MLDFQPRLWKSLKVENNSYLLLENTVPDGLPSYPWRRCPVNVLKRSSGVIMAVQVKGCQCYQHSSHIVALVFTLCLLNHCRQQCVSWLLQPDDHALAFDCSQHSGEYALCTAAVSSEDIHVFISAQGRVRYFVFLQIFVREDVFTHTADGWRCRQGPVMEPDLAEYNLTFKKLSELMNSFILPPSPKGTKKLEPKYWAFLKKYWQFICFFTLAPAGYDCGTASKMTFPFNHSSFKSFKYSHPVRNKDLSDEATSEEDCSWKWFLFQIHYPSGSEPNVSLNL